MTLLEKCDTIYRDGITRDSVQSAYTEIYTYMKDNPLLQRVYDNKTSFIKTVEQIDELPTHELGQLEECLGNEPLTWSLPYLGFLLTGLFTYYVESRTEKKTMDRRKFIKKLAVSAVFGGFGAVLGWRVDEYADDTYQLEALALDAYIIGTKNNALRYKLFPNIV